MFLVIIVGQAQTLNKNKTLTIAYIGRGNPKRIHYYTPVVENTGAAINIAIDKFMNDTPGPLHEYDIR